MIIHSLYFFHNGFNLLVFAFGVVGLLEAGAEEEGNGLVYPGCHASFIFFNDLVTVIARLPVDRSFTVKGFGAVGRWIDW